MPNQHRHKVRGIRLPDALWEPFRADCERRGETTTEAVRELIAGRLGLSEEELARLVDPRDRA